MLLLVPTGAEAQVVRIEGRVIAEDTELPLGYAEVTLRRPDGRFLSRVETDTTGTFAFVVARESAIRLSAKRLGYRAATTPVLHFDGRTYFRVEVRLDTDALLLAPLEVVVWSEVDPSPMLDAFRRRRASGLGNFISRAEIERRNPAHTSDLLRTLPGVHLSGSGRGSRPVIDLGRGAGRDCVTQIFLDGMLMNRRIGGTVPDVRLDDLVSPASIEGIEVYNGLSTIPPEFLTDDAPCGVVAVWTRRGGAGGGIRR